MASDDAQLVVRLEARIRDFERNMQRASQVAGSNFRSIERRAQQMSSRLSQSLRSSAAGIGRGWIGGIAAGLGARELKQLSDAATRINNALKVAGLSGAELEKVYTKLRDSAVRNAAPLESLVELYSRASLVQKELGVTSDELVGFSENVAMALRVSGKTAQESAGALLQLSQALGSGTVRAEEFNSIQEGAPTILQAVAAGLKEAGGSVARLRSMIIEGEISSEAFFRAFEAGAPILQDRVAGATFTVDQALGNLRTSLIDAAREFNTSTGASERFAGGINAAAQAISNFDVSGFISRISEARRALQTFLGDLGNAQVFRDLNIALGVTDEAGNMLNLDTKAAKEEAEALERDVKRLQDTIANNTALGFDNADAIAQLNEVLGKLAQVRAAIANMPVTQQVEPITGRDLTGKPYQVGTPGDPNALATRPIKMPAKITPVSVTEFAPPVGGGGGGGGRRRGGGGGGGSDGNEYDREIEQILERTAALQAETAALSSVNPLINDYDFALTKATTTHELLAAAQKAGIAITPELKASVESLAGGYAAATAEANRLADAQDQARQTADDMRMLGKDVLGGFIQDLRDCKSASEALANALSKVADKALDMALDNLFGIGGAGGGGKGGLFGGAIIPGILHGGGIVGRDGYDDGRLVSPSAFLGAPRMHSGGVAGLRHDEVAAILQKGEVVLPRGARAGGGNSVHRIILQDDSGRMAEIADQQIRTRSGDIVRVSVQQGQRQTRKNFGSMMSETQMREF